MVTWKQLKEAMKNPPPERLAKIEYKSAFMHMLGVTIACILLIIKGLWYIVFAFIFSIGMAYSQAMTAYQRYNAIISIQGGKDFTEIENDISPTRRRDSIIKEVVGKWGDNTSTVIAAATPYFIIPQLKWYLYSPAYILTLVLVYVLIYYFLLYNICYPIYKDRTLKGGESSGKKRNK